MEEAAEHLKRARFAKAIDAYRALLSEEPDNPELRATLAEAYRKAKNADRAFHHFTKAAAIYQQRGELMSAVSTLTLANEVSPNEPDILFRLCECLKLLGRTEDLKQQLVGLVRAAPAPGDRRRLWALEELFALHPDDLSVAQQRAEALGEAGRIDEAVAAYKRLSARLPSARQEFAQILLRGAQIAHERPDLGADLAEVLLAHGRAREALMVVLPYYEKFSEELLVLEVLLRCLEAIGATEKILPARIELLKARAKAGLKPPVLADVDALLALAPDDPAVLEVCAHALTVVRETQRATETWRWFVRIADRRGLKAERDRGIAALLRVNPDDEEALELAAAALAQHARFAEADTLRARLEEVRALKRRALLVQAAVPPVDTAPLAPSAMSNAFSTGSRSAADEETFPPEPITGTMILEDEDVLEEASEPQAEEQLPISKSPWADRKRNRSALYVSLNDEAERAASEKSASFARAAADLLSPEERPRLLGKVSLRTAQAIADAETRILPNQDPTPEEGTVAVSKPPRRAPSRPKPRGESTDDGTLPPWSAGEEEITSKMEPVVIDHLRTMTRATSEAGLTVLLPGELAELPVDHTEPAAETHAFPRKDD